MSTSSQPKGDHVDQAQLEYQLKIWKELAISKQMLLRTASDALKLDPNCSQDELRIALEGVLKKIAVADAEVVKAKEEARLAIAEIDRKLTASLQAQSATEATALKLQAAQEKSAREMAAERATAVTELQKFKDRLAEKERQLKAITTALADTPENVLKKMKALRKEKQDEADGRKVIETSLNSLRTDKRKQDQRIAELERDTQKLITQMRNSHELMTKLHEQLKPLIDSKELPSIPELDTKLLESLEQTDAKGKKDKEREREKRAVEA
jgi:hypothetical protein